MNRKPYLYVDETGQDTGGVLFIVGVAVIPLVFRSKLADRLIAIEKSTRKGRAKWTASDRACRLGYMRIILREVVPHVGLFYGIHQNTRDYTSATATTAADVLILTTQGDDRAMVLIDALSREGRREISVAIRRRAARANVRGVRRDENDEFIRLADAIAGFVRDAIEGHEEESQLWQRAVREGKLRDSASDM